MSIESIEKRILAEAEAFAAEKTAEAEKVKAAAVKEADGQVEGILADAKARAEQDSKLLISRRESVAGLEARKMQLNAKQELIEESFAKALEKLQNLDADDYIKFIVAQLGNYRKEKGEVLLNKADFSKIGDALKAQLKDSELTVAESDADIKGGFILRQGNISYNSSLEMLLEDKKTEMTSEIAKLLFGDN